MTMRLSYHPLVSALFTPINPICYRTDRRIAPRDRMPCAVVIRFQLPAMAPAIMPRTKYRRARIKKRSDGKK